MTKFLPLGADQFQIAAEGPSVEEIVEARIRAEALYRLIDWLPADEQEIILRVLSGETSQKTTAALLGLTESQVSHRRTSAEKKLRALAQKHASRYLYSEAA